MNNRRCSLILALLLAIAPLAGPAWAQTPPSPSPPPIEEPNEEEFPEEEIPDDEPFDEPEGDPEIKPAPAFNPISWRVDLRNQTEFISNVDQIQGAPGDGVNRTILSGSFRYTFPTNTQILLRSQFFFFKYFSLTDHDQLVFIPLGVTASQWIWERFNLYAGWLPIMLSSVGRSQGEIRRFDNDFMLGGTFYHLINNQHIFFAGYQFDFFRADVEQSRYLGNTLLAGYRHSFSDNLFAFADARAQLRGFQSTPDFLDEARLGLGLTLQWNIFRPWFTIEARSDFTQVMNLTTPDRNVGIFTLGLNLIGGVQ